MNLIIRIATILSLITGLLFFELPVSGAIATFGLNGGNHTYFEAPNHLQAQRFQNTAGTGTLNKLELQFNQASGSGNVRLGVYADNNGVPGNILLDAGQVAAGSGWVSISGLNVSVTANAYYWLAYNLQSGNTVEYQDGQIANTHVWGSASYGTLPSSFPTISYSGSNWYVMRATVSTSSPAPVPAKQWDKTFGSAGNDAGYAVIQANDGGFVIAGSTTSYGAGGTDAWLIKTDSNGNKLWDKTFGGAGTDVARSVIRTLDNGYILGGYTNSYGAGNYDVWLIKTDSNGAKIWDKTFGGFGEDQGWAVIQSADGGYVITGHSYSYGIGGYCTTWLIKTDSNGNKLWDKTYSGTWSTFGKSIIQATDGGYVVVYVDNSTMDGITKVMKTESSGNTNWTASFYGCMSNFISIIPAADGSYIIPNVARYMQGMELELSKIDNNGNILWRKAPFVNIYTNGSGYSTGTSAIQDRDGNYVFAGSASRFGAGGQDLWLVKTDSAGNALWDVTFGGTQDEIANSIIRASDGSYVIAGTTSSYGAGGSDIWLLKVGQDSGPPAVPTLVSPGDGATASGNSINFQWSVSSGATNYWLAVLKSSDNSVVINKTVGNVTTDVETGFPNDGTAYKWVVAAGNSAGWSGSSTVRMFINGTLTPPSQPNLISPADGVTMSGSSVTFQWSASSGATNYWLAVFKDDGSPVINKSLGNVISTTEGGFPNNGTKYVWTVAAGNTSGWSAASWKHFTNGTLSPPPPPNLISPADGAVVNGTSITFQWSASSGATNYWLAVFKDDGSPVINKSLGNVTSTTEGGFPNNGTKYVWTVAAGNIAGWSIGATWKHFYKVP